MIQKGSALYLHAPRPNYDCDDCVFFISPTNRCVLHGLSDYIAPEGSCGYFIQGPINFFGTTPLNLITKQESGYVDFVNEASCKRCTQWIKEGWSCETVDKDSPGDDPNMIHPDACCCLWIKDSERGSMPNEALDAI